MDCALTSWREGALERLFASLDNYVPTQRYTDKGEVGGSSPPRPTIFLLHETDIGRRSAFGHFLDRAELRLVARDILS
jgi:hypothetical protein